MGAQATKPAPEPVAEGAGTAAAMLEEIRKQGAAMLADAQETARTMLAEAQEQAKSIASTAGDAVLTQERQLVEQAQKDFRAVTDPNVEGRVWLQHEAEEDFEPVIFRAKAGVKSQLRMVRIARYRYDVNGQERLSPGAAYQFSEGELIAKSQDVADWVRSRPGFNVVFWEAGNEPHSAPDPGVMLDKVLDATLELDVEKLEELRGLEQGSHKRPLVLKRIDAALSKIHGRTQG